MSPRRAPGGEPRGAPAAPAVGPRAAAPGGVAREILPATLTALVTMLVAFAIGPRGYSYTHTAEFIRMIHGTPSDAVAPICYRVLVPTLMKFIPLEPRAAFLLLTGLSTLLTLLAAFVLLRQLGYARRPALLAMSFLGFSYPVALYLAYWGMADPAANFLEVLALVGLAGRRPLLTTAALGLGCLAKESNLLLLPLCAWWFRDLARQGWRERLQFGGLVLVPLVVTALLRLLIHGAPGLALGYAAGWSDYPRLWGVWAANIRQTGLLRFLAAVFLRSYGFTWILAALGFPSQRTWRGVCLYLLACGVALCFVGADRSRMLGFAFMGLLIPTAAFLQRLMSRGLTTWPLLLLTALTVTQCAITLAGVPLGARASDPSLVRWHALATLGNFLAGTGVALLGWRGTRRGRVSLCSSQELPQEQQAART